MSFKCLNCHMVCAASDAVCPSCGYKVADTSYSNKKGSASKVNMKFALIFMIIGSAIFNTVIAPKMYPSAGRTINMDRVLMASIVGMVCALLGAVFGSLVTDRD
jgi:hypothetical protein